MKVKSSNSLSSANVSQVDWCLAATISAPFGKILQAAKLDLGAADDAQQPHADASPQLGHLEDGAARQHQRDQRHQEQHDQVQIEQDVEEDGPDDDHVLNHCVRLFRRPIRTSNGSQMRTRATIYFKYSKNSSRAVSGFSHQASTRTLSETTAKGHQRHLRAARARSSTMARGMWKFAVTTISDWKPRAFTQRRVSTALPMVLVRIVDIDAAGEPALMLRHQPRDFARPRRRIDAADQEALAAAGGQQIERIVDPERPAGQRHDAVGIARGRNLGHRHLVDEPKKSAAEQTPRRDPGPATVPSPRRDGGGGTPPRSAASAAAGPEPMASISPDLPANDNAKSGVRMAQRYSTVSRVRFTVRRDATAVTTATSTICATIAR